ncbi:MAG: LPS-assembly protein LptD, partial [Alphaproteobacteria bacterium]|nr:LPS-assembly protein LptD [Alphaproteobacteria bacterium]
MKSKRTILAIVLSVALLGLAAPARAAEATAPATFSADEMTHDREMGVITARGRVEVNYDGYTLLADRISYSQNADLVRAMGDVTLLRPNGDVMFAVAWEGQSAGDSYGINA